VQRLLDLLRGGELLVGDGAWGTQLLERGLKPGGCPEEFNLEQPEILSEIADRYVEAGAEILTTNTFGGSGLRLRPFGLEDRTEQVNEAAVEAARHAAGDRARVSGSVGPTGSILKPYGDADESEVRETFERQILALTRAGVDLLCIETMTDLREAILAVKAAKAIAPAVPVAATMTFEPTRRGYFTVMGVTVEQAAGGLGEAGADLVGSNCGIGIEAMIGVAREFKRHTPLPMVIQPNAGLPQNRGGRVVYPETPEFMADKARELIDLRVSVLGGCCGTTPEHVRAIRNVVDAWRRGD
jgi:5-methyltetrahydrofolate--homocysteine methyltransferase